MELARALGFKPWKIIAATATIRISSSKRGNSICSGPDNSRSRTWAYDSFYYRQNTRESAVSSSVFSCRTKAYPGSYPRAFTLVLGAPSCRDWQNKISPPARVTYGTSALSSEEFRQPNFSSTSAPNLCPDRKGSDQVAEAIDRREERVGAT